MLLRPHYARVDQEGRTLVHELFAAIGDIRVSDRELQSPWPAQPPTPNARRPGPL